MNNLSPDRVLKSLRKKVGTDGLIAFLSVVIIGLATHLTIMTSDVANHDGLEFMYSNYNLITSGRWFNKWACGITSFYSIPWLISVLSLIYLGISAILLVKLLKVKSPVFIVLMSGILVTFPTITSNFAYVFTMDGYMLAVLLAILSVYMVPKHKLGFVFGGIALAFSMGIYQGYVTMAMLLCLYQVLMIFGEKADIKVKVKSALKYLLMGIIGIGLYYLILKIGLLIMGTSLTNYQGINEMSQSTSGGLFSTIKYLYTDFAAFILKSKFMFSNVISLVACIILGIAFVIAFVVRAKKREWFRSPFTYLIVLASLVLIPLLANAILLISTEVTYHSLMRYQYSLFGVLALAFIESVVGEAINYEKRLLTTNICSWMAVISALLIVFAYAVSDNIGYSNLQKKYEKTYAYCLRLADRIEQTEGYYEGIPIYMIGVVGDDNFPVTDITEKVTGGMLGIGGDYLLYTPANYEFFYKYYMGITFNFLMPEDANYYDEDYYVEMPSFPYEGSTKVVNGVLFVKTENSNRD